MNKKTAFYIGFFAVLVVVFYFVMTWLIPGFGKPSYPPIGRVEPFSFTNQYGELFTEKNLEGKVFVTEYFFTTCEGICPRMNTNMKLVHDRFKGEPDFLIVSHTSDPKKDSVAVLNAYADSLGVNQSNWVFLTGRKDSLYNMARYSYKIDDPGKNLISIEQDFIHSQFFALVNKKGEVRKIYDGLLRSEVDRLVADIEKLLKE